MLRLFRRLALQLRTLHLSSIASEGNVRFNQPVFGPKHANLYNESTSTLPSVFVTFLKEFNDIKRPTDEQLEETMKSVQHQHIRFILSEIIKQDLLYILLHLIPYLVKNQLIDNKTVIPTTQALTKAWIKLGPTKEFEAIAGQLYEFLPPDEICKGLRMMLNLCANQWPVLDADADLTFILKNECFDALVVGALRHSDLKMLQIILKKFPYRFIHSDSNLFQTFLDFVKPDSRALVSTYLQHLEGQMITDSTFTHIKRIASQARCLKIRASSVVDGKCKVCRTALEERKLLSSEYNKLKLGFSHYLREGCVTNLLGSKIEFYALEKKISYIKANRKYRSSIVLDTLNLNRGRLIEYPGFVDDIQKLKDKYDLIVLITRNRMLSEQITMLKQKGIELFSVGKYSQDDLFAIYMSISLGPDTVLISNDRFNDIAADLKKKTDISELFHIWQMNQVTRFYIPMRITSPNRYSNLLHYSPESESCHFMVFYDDWNGRRKLFCLKH